MTWLFMQAADSKREEFRKYLEKAGVLDALTKGTCKVLKVQFFFEGWLEAGHAIVHYVAFGSI